MANLTSGQETTAFSIVLLKIDDKEEKYRPGAGEKRLENLENLVLRVHSLSVGNAVQSEMTYILVLLQQK